MKDVLRLRFIVVLTLILFLFMAGCSKQPVYRETKVQIGTVVTLTATGVDRQTAYAAFERAFDEVDRISALMGPCENSDVIRINTAESSQKVKIKAETAHVIGAALRLSRQTGGAFDITFEALGKLWDYKAEPFVVPQQKQIDAALQNVGYEKLSLDNDVLVKTSGAVRIGLGAIAKGYIIGRCVSVMKQSGIQNGIVDAGGDIQVFGSRAQKNWVAAVAHPREKGNLLLKFPLLDGEACVTSGDYERFAIASDGTRYHHIIDPRTGYPTRTFSSVTIISDDPMMADALATAVFVLGWPAAGEFLHANPKYKAILIDEHMQCRVSGALMSRLVVIDDTLKITQL